jgi:hypothetical protein
MYARFNFRSGNWSWALALVLLCTTACRDVGLPPYDFTDPVEHHQLPEQLKELSGLVVLQSNYVAGVDDETGTFYLIDFVSGEVVREQRFGPPGDYEDISSAGSGLYILRGDGAIYHIRDVRDRPPEPEVFRAAPIQEAEGLYYDPASHRLLIGSIALGSNGERTGAVYAFDLRSRTLVEDPLFLIPMDSVLQALDGPPPADTDDGVFKPSAVAIQPGTGDIYLVSAKTRLFVITDRQGSIKAATLLPADLFPEPESITFLSTGDIVIGNEDEGERPASILRFRHLDAFQRN